MPVFQIIPEERSHKKVEVITPELFDNIEEKLVLENRPVLVAINENIAEIPFPYEPLKLNKLKENQLIEIVQGLLTPDVVSIRVVPLNNVIGNKETVEISRLEDSNDIPIVVQLGENFSILRGHHSLTNAFLRNEKQVQVRVIELPLGIVTHVESVNNNSTKGPLTAQSYMGDIAMPPITINLTIADKATAKKTITTSRDENGNLIASISES